MPEYLADYNNMDEAFEYLFEPENSPYAIITEMKHGQKQYYTA